jgi:uncharacterized protein (AIM24 family)
MYLSPQVDMLVSYAGCCTRCCGGESCFVLNYTNNSSSGPGYAALAPSVPLGKVVPIDLTAPDVGGTLIVQQGKVECSPMRKKETNLVFGKKTHGTGLLKTPRYFAPIHNRIVHGKLW